jgi:hypothetical protein
MYMSYGIKIHTFHYFNLDPAAVDSIMSTFILSQRILSGRMVKGGYDAINTMTKTFWRGIDIIPQRYLRSYGPILCGNPLC